MFIKSSKFLVTGFFWCYICANFVCYSKQKLILCQCKTRCKIWICYKTLYLHFELHRFIFLPLNNVKNLCINKDSNHEIWVHDFFFACSQLNITCHSMLHETDSLVLRRFSWLWLNWIATTGAKSEKNSTMLQSTWNISLENLVY